MPTWEERFSVDGYIYGTEPNEFLRDNVAILPRGSVLCLAEGEGRNSVFLAESGFDVHSVDLTHAGVAKTLQLAAKRGVTVDAVVGDLADHDLGAGQWDVIVSIFAHTDADTRRRVHRDVVPALKADGVFLLEAYTVDQIGRGTGGPSNPDMMMSLAKLADELPGLEVLHGAELVREIVEGPGHTGFGAVVQLIARKPG